MPAPCPVVVAPDARRPRPRRTLVTVAAVLALVFGACGDDENDSGATVPSVDDAADTIDSAIDEFQDEVANGTNGSDTSGGTRSDSSDDVPTGTADVAEELRANGAANLASLVEQVDMEQVSGGDGYTLFAPNDDAFRALTQDDFAALLDEPERIIEILRSHVVSERVTASELAEQSSIDVVSGERLEVGTSDGNVTVDGAQVVRTDITIGNVVIHVVDQVLTL